MNNNRIGYVRIPTALYSMDGLSTLQVNVLALVAGFGQDGLQLSSKKLAGVFGVTSKTIDTAIVVMTNKGYVQDIVKQRGKRRRLVATSVIFSVVNPAEPPKKLQTTTEEITELPPKKLQTTTVKTTVSTKHNRTELNKKGTKTFSPTSDEVRLAQLLIDLILARKPDYKKPDLQSWARHIDLMIRHDHRKPERIKAVIKWCQNDAGNGNSWDGWQNNILSTEKLREKFDKLELSLEKSNNARTPKIRPKFRAAPDAITI